VLPKKWNGNVFLLKRIFQRKKAKTQQIDQTNFLRPTNLRWGQERPKGQIKLFRPTNLKRGQISEIWSKKGQSETLGSSCSTPANHSHEGPLFSRIVLQVSGTQGA